MDEYCVVMSVLGDHSPHGQLKLLRTQIFYWGEQEWELPVFGKKYSIHSHSKF